MLDWFGSPKQQQDNHEDDTRPKRLVLMEVVSARNLEHRKTIFDQEVDPCCVVFVDSQKVHQTATIYNDADPIWTVKTKSLCLLEIPTDDDENNVNTSDESNDITTDDKDYVEVQVCHGSQCIGVVTVPFRRVLESNGERQEYPISVKAVAGDDDENRVRTNVSKYCCVFSYFISIYSISITSS